MTDETPRLRMFAGPNGSGKSTLKLLLPPRLQGVYLNPDDMQKEMAATGAYPLPVQAGITSGDGLLTHLKESTFLRTAMAESDVRKLGFAGGAMLYLVLDELIPESIKDGGVTLTAWGVMLGLCGMLLISNLLNALPTF